MREPKRTRSPLVSVPCRPRSVRLPTFAAEQDAAAAHEAARHAADSNRLEEHLRERTLGRGPKASNFPGVSKSGDKWHASISRDGKQHHLGTWVGFWIWVALGREFDESEKKMIPD